MQNLVIIVISLLLVVFGGGVTAAQSETAEKSVPRLYHPSVRAQAHDWQNRHDWVAERVCFGWSAPQAAPDSYRIQWKLEGATWRSIAKPNSKQKGNAILTATRACIGNKNIVWDINKKLRDNQIDGSLAFKLHKHSMLIRVRARYNGEKNGPWLCCLRISGRRTSERGGTVQTSVPEHNPPKTPSQTYAHEAEAFVYDVTYRDPECDTTTRKQQKRRGLRCGNG